MRNSFWLALYALAVMLFLASEVTGQTGLSTRALEEIQNSFTVGGLWGAPRYTTALLPSCTAANTGAVAFDTTLGALVACNGSSWD